MSDSSKINRQEAKRQEEKRLENKQQLEQRMKKEGMKTFEAKLSEKTAHEETSRQSTMSQLKNSSQADDEKNKILDKILGVVQDKATEQDKARVKGVVKQDEETEARREEKKDVDSEFETKEDEKTEESRGQQKTESKDEKSPHGGHKRVTEKQEGEGGSGGGGEFSQDQGDPKQFQSQAQEKKGQSKDVKDKFVQALSKGKSSGGFSSGFDQSAKKFSKTDLEELVQSVQLTLNEDGQEQLELQLSDDYFDGVKLISKRTPDGVVLRFECPNVTVKSTFLKFRLDLASHFQKKGISVHRIEVV